MNIAWHALRPEVAHIPTVVGVGLGFWALQPLLCDVTMSLAAVMLTYGAGVPALRDAGFLQLAQHQMSTAKACSGLAWLAGVIMLFTFARFAMFERWPRLRLGVCAGALPVAIVAQAARISVQALWL